MSMDPSFKVNGISKDRGDFYKSWRASCKEVPAEKYILQILELLDSGRCGYQTAMNVIAKKFGLTKKGFITKKYLDKDLITLATQYKSELLFNKVLDHISNKEVEELLAEKKAMSITTEWAEKLFSELSPSKDQMKIKLIARGMELDKKGLVTEYQLKSNGPDIAYKEILKIAADMDSPKLLAAALEGYTSNKNMKSEAVEHDIIEALELAKAINSDKIIKFILDLSIAREGFEDTDHIIFDKCLESFGDISTFFTENGQNLLQLLIAENNVDLMRHFRDKYISDESLQRKFVTNKDIKGSNAIHYAAIYGNDAMLEELLKFEGALDAIKSSDGPEGSPLSIALSRGYYGEDSVAYKLLEAGADPRKSLSLSELAHFTSSYFKTDDKSSLPALKLMHEMIQPGSTLNGRGYKFLDTKNRLEFDNLDSYGEFFTAFMLSNRKNHAADFGWQKNLQKKIEAIKIKACNTGALKIIVASEYLKKALDQGVSGQSFDSILEKTKIQFEDLMLDDLTMLESILPILTKAYSENLGNLYYNLQNQAIEEGGLALVYLIGSMGDKFYDDQNIEYDLSLNAESNIYEFYSHKNFEKVYQTLVKVYREQEVKASFMQKGLLDRVLSTMDQAPNDEVLAHICVHAENIIQDLGWHEEFGPDVISNINHLLQKTILEKGSNAFDFLMENQNFKLVFEAQEGEFVRLMETSKNGDMRLNAAKYKLSEFIESEENIAHRKDSHDSGNGESDEEAGTRENSFSSYDTSSSESGRGTPIHLKDYPNASDYVPAAIIHCGTQCSHELTITGDSAAFYVEQVSLI